MTPDPPTPADQLRDLMDEAARRAIRDEVGPLVSRIAEYIRQWGETPPRPGGVRDRIAAEVERKFGVK